MFCLLTYIISTSMCPDTHREGAVLFGGTPPAMQPFISIHWAVVVIATVRRATGDIGVVAEVGGRDRGVVVVGGINSRRWRANSWISNSTSGWVTRGLGSTPNSTHTWPTRPLPLIARTRLPLSSLRLHWPHDMFVLENISQSICPRT